MSEDNKSDWSKREMGAFWTQEGKKGKYLTGYIEVDESGVKQKVRVVVFPNRHKTNDKAPDYKIYVSEPKPQKKDPAPNNEELPDSLV